MNCRLLVTVSVLALVHGLPGAHAGEKTPAAGGLLLDAARPVLPLHIPTTPSYTLGVGAIADGQGGIDPVVTGQISNPDAEKAVEALTPHAPSVAAAEAASADAEHAEGEAPADGAAHWPTARGPMPYDIIRTIQFLQDQIARGNGRAIQVQAMLLRRFGPSFVQADPDVWKDPRNRRAAVLFVLSGGPPEVLRALLASGSLDVGQEPVFKGALAYVQNDLESAKSILSGIDYTGMEPGLEAHINLVLGQLMQLDKPKDAIAHLDRARLLAPGGLIEEAALRMEVLLVDGLGDHDAADRLARQYFDHYSDSSYSPNFEARFAAVYSSRGKDDPAAAEATMLDVTERLPDPNKRAIFLAVGRRALIEGHLDFARRAAEAVLAMDDTPDEQKQRARLYVAAATMGKTSAETLAAELAAIDRETLFTEDASLFDAASSVLVGIDRTPELVAAAGEAAPEPSPVIDRAQQLLNDVANDLGKAQ